MPENVAIDPVKFLDRAFDYVNQWATFQARDYAATDNKQCKEQYRAYIAAAVILLDAKKELEASHA